MHFAATFWRFNLICLKGLNDVSLQIILIPTSSLANVVYHRKTQQMQHPSSELCKKFILVWYSGHIAAVATYYIIFFWHIFKFLTVLIKPCSKSVILLIIWYRRKDKKWKRLRLLICSSRKHRKISNEYLDLLMDTHFSYAK